MSTGGQVDTDNMVYYQAKGVLWGKFMKEGTKHLIVYHLAAQKQAALLQKKGAGYAHKYEIAMTKAMHEWTSKVIPIYETYLHKLGHSYAKQQLIDRGVDLLAMINDATHDKAQKHRRLPKKGEGKSARKGEGLT